MPTLRTKKKNQKKKTASLIPCTIHTRRLQRTDFKDSRASSDRVVRDRGVATRQDDVSLAGDGCRAIGCRWDGEGEAAVDGRCAAEWIRISEERERVCVWDGRKDLRSKYWASDSDESAVNLRFSIGCRDNGARGQESDLRTSGDVAVLGRGSERRESLRRSR